MQNNVSLQINVDSREANLKLLSRDGNLVHVLVDDEEYKLDICQVEQGVYSILKDGRSYIVELIEGDSKKKYIVNTYRNNYDLEIVDAESRFMKNRNKGLSDEAANSISSPMPGKVVKIPVKEGDEVKKGEPVIVISAMKMESEYKAPRDGFIQQICVGEGDTVDGNQPLVILE
jgi:biotin carboxyl carrier protein